MGRGCRAWRRTAGRPGCLGRLSGPERLGRPARRGPTGALRVALASAVLCAALSLPGSAAAAAATSGYAFAEGARTVKGAASTTDAEQLRPGETYRSSIAKNAKLYYRLDLTAPVTAYLPVTAVPPPGAT